MNIFFGIAVGLVLLFVLVSFAMGMAMINIVMKAKRSTYEDIRKQDASYAEGFDDYENLWERHEFSLPVEGATISGEYIVNHASPDKPKKVAIICHGHTAIRASDFKYGRIFYNLGYNLIVFDERYFGASTAKYCTLGMNESKDIAKIQEYAKEIFGEDAFIALHGESMGAASELLALSYSTPDLVVADCPFASTTWQFKDVAKKLLGRIFDGPAMFFGGIIGILRAGYDFRKVNPIDSVRTSEVPICFIHGAADSYITCKQSEEMYKVCKNPLSEIHFVEGADHAMSFGTDPKAYEELIRNFVKKIEAN